MCVSFLERKAKQLDINLSSIHFGLTLTYYNPNEVMRGSGILTKKGL